MVAVDVHGVLWRGRRFPNQNLFESAPEYIRKTLRRVRELVFLENSYSRLPFRNPTATGLCNDFPCGDISSSTLDKIRETLKKKAYSFIVDEDSSILLLNERELMKVIKKESPETYFEWTLNGVFINVNSRVGFQGDDIMIKSAKPSDSGTYVSMVYRINGHRVILKVITLAVRAKNFDIDTRATWSYTLQCHSVILGYVYADLSLKLVLNNATYLNHGLTTLAAVNAHALDPLNQSNSGIWQCVVEQKDLKLKWVTNYVKLNVKSRPNFYTHLMEDKLTRPFFGWLKSETSVLTAVIFIIVTVFLGVVAFLFVYFKFCALESRYKRNRRF